MRRQVVSIPLGLRRPQGRVAAARGRAVRPSSDGGVRSRRIKRPLRCGRPPAGGGELSGPLAGIIEAYDGDPKRRARLGGSCSGGMHVAARCRNLGTAITVGNQPYWIAITPDQATAYVANYNANAASTVTPINLSTNRRPMPCPRQLGLT